MRHWNWMKTGAVSLALLFVMGVSADAAVKIIGFDLTGSGALAQPTVGYDGMVDQTQSYPFPQIDFATGTFSISIDDTGWPGDNPGTLLTNERWVYVFATYFTYVNTAGSEHWEGYFPVQGGTDPEVDWTFITGEGYKLGGTMNLTLTISDTDADGFADAGELATIAIAGNVFCKAVYSTGEFLGYCGSGSMNGMMNAYDQGNPPMGAYDVTGTGGTFSLNNTNCQVPVEEKTWGAVKAIYSE
jgi:hypothetical protein